MLPSLPVLGRFFFNGLSPCTFLNVSLNTKAAGLKKPTHTSQKHNGVAGLIPILTAKGVNYAEGKAKETLGVQVVTSGPFCSSYSFLFVNPGMSLKFTMSHRWVERSFCEPRPSSL